MKRRTVVATTLKDELAELKEATAAAVRVRLGADGRGLEWE